METVNIKGKEYVMVNERIKHFRSDKAYEGWSLDSEIMHMDFDNGVCCIKATIRDAESNVRASGFAFEREQSSFINKTSFIENCETSAWGRALGNLGIGVDASIATADEVANAIKQQEDVKKPNSQSTKKEPANTFLDKMRGYYKEIDHDMFLDCLKDNGIPSLDAMSKVTDKKLADKLLIAMQYIKDKS